MANLIVLLSPAELTGRFEEAMRAGGASVKVAPVDTLSALETVCRDRAGHFRLVAFATDVIVLAHVLAALGGPAYNLHPGPPEYPGLFPSCFAIDEGAACFGSTLHEMNERVDEGAIVGIDTFDMPAGIDRQTLDALALASAMRLVAHLAEELADIPTPLRPLPVAWSGRRRTAKDFAALCEIPPDISADDFAHRYRAVGEGPDHALTVVLHGRRFRLAPEGDAMVYVGGQAVAAAEQ